MRVAERSFLLCPPADLLKQHPALRREASAMEQAYAVNHVVPDEALKQVGAHLWQVLDQDGGLEEALGKLGNQVLPILISSGDAEIQYLPWELLYHQEQGFLGRKSRFTLSRSLAVPEEHQAEPAPLETGPLRVLLFTALPDDMDAHRSRLDVEEEQARVLEALLPRIAEGRVELEMPDDGRFSTFKDLLRNFRPHVVFLSGHGKFYHQPHTGEEPFGIFLFEDEIDQGHAVQGEELATALIGAPVECLVLSACESGKAASTSLTAGLARRLAQQGIPQVIGMRESLQDLAGILLAHAFCDAVAQGERVDLALQEARQAIQQAAGSSEGSGVLRDNSELSGAVELSRGQWCLPMLFTQDPARPLIDWNFAPKPPQVPLSRGLGDLTLPPLFIGRRSELRRIRRRLFREHAGQLLLTGPGGQGKTALAGKLALDLERRGFTSLVFQAGLDEEETEQRLKKFTFRVRGLLRRLLGPEETRDFYKDLEANLDNEQDRLEMLLEELLRATGNTLVLVLDNLESLQERDSLEISNESVRSWLAAARKFVGKGLILLLTSRHCLPDWPAADHQSLGKTNYGDFLAMARQLRLPFSFYGDRKRLRRAYEVLHGNGRGLEFFAAAIKEMNAREEEELFLALERAREEIQVNMCLEEIITRLSPEEKGLLERLPVYPVPVPLEGLVKLGLDLPNPEGCLQRLLDLSLLEQRWNPRLQTEEYQCPALVCELLAQQAGPPATPLRSLAADYLIYLFEQGQYRSVQHIITCHQALQMAERQEEADRLALDYIVGWLSRDGQYQALLEHWLPAICRSEDEQTRAEALGQTGKQLLHIGSYSEALDYLKQSLAIRREIGDKSGEGTTLNNISQIFKARGDYETALDYLKQSLAIRREIGDKSGEGTTLNNISQIYDARGDYETALDYLKQSLAIRREIGDKSGEGTTLNNISQIFKARGDYETALDYLKQSLAIQREIGDKSGEGTTLNNISALYHARGDYETALDYLKQSLAIQREIGDKSGEGTTLNNISQIYDARGDYETALDYLKQSLAIRREIGDKSGEGTTLNNISQIYDARGDYETALDYLKQSLAIQREIGDVAGLCATMFNMGHIHIQNEEVPEALGCWVQVYLWASKMNLAQALAALERLAGQLGLEGGLQGWARLAKQLMDAEDSSTSG